MDKITVNAYAKINLGLDVTGRRSDGYHTVKMIMQTIQLYDKLTVTLTRQPDIHIKSNLAYLPVNENNLVYAAADLFRRTYNIKSGIHINLVKRIPVAAGMAGGSADAAATLHAMNRLFETGVPLDELQKLGLTLGADVPFCLMNGTALSEGIGEILTPLMPPPPCRVLIVKPSFSISTRMVYEKLDSGISHHPDIDGILDSISNPDINKMCSCLENVLETVSVEMYPEISQIKSKMLELGANGSLMSGSGPTVFGLFTDNAAAEKAFYEFKVSSYGRQTFLVDMYNPQV